MQILVQKFGGTSVSTPERRQQVVNKIANAKRSGYSPVVVVSALGRVGEPYATDTLFNLARQECPSIGGRELDMIMACGEIVAGVIVVGALNNAGFDAVFLNGQQAGIMTTMKHGNAQIIQVKPETILRQIDEGRIVVVAGFQGVSENGEITTLGRGGSDTSATALGAAIGAVAVEIYTDVNGIMTADPRIVSTAHTIEFGSYEEVYQLALHGAKVIHPRAVKIAWHHNLPLQIKCTFTDETGTTISNGLNGTIERLKGPLVVGIAHQTNYGILRLKDANPNVLENVGMLLNKLVVAGIGSDYINISNHAMELISNAAAIEAVEALVTYETGVELGEKLSGCAKISLIGHSANNVPRLPSTFIEVLRREKIGVLQTFSGPYTISGIVDQDDMIPAIQALHASLFESQKSSSKRMKENTSLLLVN